MAEERLAAAYQERYGEPAPDFAGVPQAERLAALIGRRSCRAYTEQTIDEPLLTALLAAAQSAPSKSDLQQYAIVVLDDPAVREPFLALPSIPDWAADAARLLVFCADTRRGRRMTELKGLDYRCDTVDTLVNAAGDAGIALMAFVAAAEAVGLGCCPLSVVRNHIAEVTELLALPPGVFPFAGLTVGWPARAGYVSLRLPQAAVVHRDRYDDGALAEHLEGYDAKRHARAPIAPDKRLHRERYGDGELRWSDNAARRLSVRERPEFRDHLLRHGVGLD